MSTIKFLKSRNQLKPCLISLDVKRQLIDRKSSYRPNVEARA